MKYILLFFLSFFTLISCQKSKKEVKISKDQIQVKVVSAEDEQAFYAIMQKHLDAVSNKDLVSLKSTMHPDGKCNSYFQLKK